MQYMSLEGYMSTRQEWVIFAELVEILQKTLTPFSDAPVALTYL